MATMVCCGFLFLWCGCWVGQWVHGLLWSPMAWLSIWATGAWPPMVWARSGRACVASCGLPWKP
eukprot:1801417-Pyramimonas_sp.AAC.1